MPNFRPMTTTCDCHPALLGRNFRRRLACSPTSISFRNRSDHRSLTGAPDPLKHLLPGGAVRGSVCHQQTKSRELLEREIDEVLRARRIDVDRNLLDGSGKRGTIARPVDERQQPQRVRVGDPHVRVQQRCHVVARTRLQTRKRTRDRSVGRPDRERGRMHVQIDDAQRVRVGEDGFERPRQRTEIAGGRSSDAISYVAGWLATSASSSLRTAPPPPAAGSSLRASLWTPPVAAARRQRHVRRHVHGAHALRVLRRVGRRVAHERAATGESGAGGRSRDIARGREDRAWTR